MEGPLEREHGNIDGHHYFKLEDQKAFLKDGGQPAEAEKMHLRRSGQLGRVLRPVIPPNDVFSGFENRFGPK